MNNGIIDKKNEGKEKKKNEIKEETEKCVES
jgi:hypothetical protein